MIAQFALRLVSGISLMWCLMPRSKVTAGFFRIQMLVALGLSVLTIVTWEINELPDSGSGSSLAQQFLTQGTWVGGVLAGLAFVGSVLWTLVRRRAGDVFCFAIAALSNTWLALLAWQNFEGSAFAVFVELTAAATLGAVMTGMLLGHWYLTAPTMSIDPLRRLNLFVLVAAMLRLAGSGLVLARHHAAVTSLTHVMWLSLLWIAGILGPLLVAVMVFRILRYRNTQSATGVLFVGVILSFIGEMSASLLAHELRLPF